MFYLKKYISKYKKSGLYDGYMENLDILSMTWSIIERDPSLMGINGKTLITTDFPLNIKARVKASFDNNTCNLMRDLRSNILLIRYSKVLIDNAIDKMSILINCFNHKGNPLPGACLSYPPWWRNINKMVTINIFTKIS